jgi:hypothetical protein
MWPRIGRAWPGSNEEKGILFRLTSPAGLAAWHARDASGGLACPQAKTAASLRANSGLWNQAPIDRLEVRGSKRGRACFKDFTPLLRPGVLRPGDEKETNKRCLTSLEHSIRSCTVRQRCLGSDVYLGELFNSPQARNVQIKFVSWPGKPKFNPNPRRTRSEQPLSTHEQTNDNLT